MQGIYCDLLHYVMFSTRKHCVLCNNMEVNLSWRRRARTGEEYKYNCIGPIVLCYSAMLLILLMLLAPLTAANSTKSLPVMKHQMCSDLCTSGLGGAPCGELCSEDLGFDLQSRLRQYTTAIPRKKEIYGPRRAVCPLLCRSNLGDPLCGCHIERCDHICSQ
jgi:hypothetical protein